MSVKRTSYQLANQVRFFGKEIAELLSNDLDDRLLNATLEGVVTALAEILIFAREARKEQLCDH